MSGCQDGQVSVLLWFPPQQVLSIFLLCLNALSCLLFALLSSPKREAQAMKRLVLSRVSFWSVDLGCSTVWTYVSAGRKTFTGRRLQTLHSEGIRPTAATERGCTKLCDALSCAMQNCRQHCSFAAPSWGKWGVRAEALNLTAMVIRIMSGRWDWHLPAGPHVVQGACSLT